MPQDSLRSAVYRSFVTCDDPKGVVQCGTIRRSKASSHKMKHHHKVESQHTSLASMIEREDMGSKRELHSSSSSLQLLEVSRGAEKLNQMINSWSDGRSGDVAKDLLKGALDLQESLVMLGKLQEASKCMVRLKKEKDRERSRSDRFMGQNQNQDGSFQRHRVSVDGPSRDCIDQLREVIRDSFASQNLLLPNTRREQKAYFHQRSFGSDLEMPSTSSSQSSTTDRSNSNKFDSTVSSLSPAALKAKGPSLIARLMGLEEIPSKPAMKPQLTAQKVDSVKRAVEGTQEAVQLKRVLKGDSLKEFKPQSHHFLEARPRCRAVDDIAPIVLIKPMRAGGSQDFESLEPRCWDEETLKTKLFLRQLKMKGEHSPKVGECEEKISSDKMLRNGGAEETVSKRVGRELKKPDEMAVKTKGRVSNKLKAPEQINQKQQKNEAIDKRVDKVQKVALTSRKPAEKETVKSPSSRPQDQTRMAKTRPGVSDNRSNMRKPRIPEKKNTATPNPISKSTKQPLVHSSSRRTKNQADEKEKAKKKKPASAQTTTLSPTTQNDLVDKETIATFTDHLITREEEAYASELQSVEKETIATFADNLITPEEETDSSELHLEEKETIATFIDHLTTEEEVHASELYSDEFGTIATTFTDHLITEEETDASEFQIEEDCIGSAMLNPEHGRDSESAVQVLDDEGLKNITDHTSSRTQTKLEAFLLGSPSFMRHLEDLFDLNISFPLPLQALNINGCGVASAELSLDCANELVKRRSLPDSRKIHPLLLTCTGNTRICISLDQLMEEVCDGIETLRSYAHTGSESLAVNNLYAALERDMWSNGVVNGTWDLGWRNGFSVDEADQVVNDVEKLLLSQLIEEAFA